MSSAAPKLRSPYPWPGGKRKVADVVWQRFGAVQNYVEPFFGSGAVLLARPRPFGGVETINDRDGFVSNFWRALQAVPDEVASHADWPVNENDLHARHAWLVERREDLTVKLEGDPEYFDVKIAGWWVWGLCCWLGSGWCSGRGPWVQQDGLLVHAEAVGRDHVPDSRSSTGVGAGITRKRVRLGRGAGGVCRQMPDASGMGGRGIHGITRRGLGDQAFGVHRKQPEVGAKGGRGVHGSGDRARDGLVAWMHELAERLRHVRVCCGDFDRVLGPTPTLGNGTTAIFLDPPYALETGRDSRIYAVDSDDVSARARAFALAAGDNPKMRIALCGYQGEHEMPSNWSVYRWSAQGGYANQAAEYSGRADLETIWFSPHCIAPAAAPQLSLGLGA